MYEHVKTVGDFRRHLELVQTPAHCGTWTPKLDAALVVGVLQGGVDRAVIATGRSRDACLGRWDCLYPPELRGIERQAHLRRLIEKLAAEAEAQESAAQAAGTASVGA